MKTILLMRHAEPLRLPDVARAEWPLSECGHESAMHFFGQPHLKAALHVYTSPLLRAVQTAQHADLPMTVDWRLVERRTGMEMPEVGDCWLRQYEDGTFKCPGGESFEEVAQRVTACVDDILAELKAGQSAVVVSHAAAICAYFKQYCAIRVTDRATKTREILWGGRQVYQGQIPPLTCFRLTFCQGQLANIEALL